MSGGPLGILAFCVVTTALIIWAWKAMAVRVPKRFGTYQIAVAAGCVLAILAFARGTGGGPSAVSAAFALVAGGMYLVFSMTSRMDRKTPAVRMGGPILDFTAVDGDGATFRLSSLRGSPFLLKFFRGHW